MRCALVLLVLLGCSGARPKDPLVRKDLECRMETADADAQCKAKGPDCGLDRPLRCSGVRLPPEKPDPQRACVCLCSADYEECANTP
jgi:hypothetical protein